MERKKRVLLTVIAVATLLVAVVGATFAYFTATTSTTGKEASSNVTTKKVGSTSFNLTGRTIENKLDYPGGMEIIEGKVAAKRTDDDDSNNYNFAYGLTIEATNNLETTLTWKLYEQETELSLDSGSTTCKLVTEAGKGDQSNETWYYYTNDGTDTDSGGSDCTAENLLKAKLINQVPIAEGTILKGSSVSYTKGEEDLGSRTISTNDANEKNKYYYLVIEYPNSNDQTKNDAGKAVSISLKLKDNVIASIAE